jgi:AraC-like DNA-binding protein
MVPSIDVSTLAPSLSALVVGQSLTLGLMLAAPTREATSQRWLALLIGAVGFNSVGDLVESGVLALPVALAAWLTPLTSVTLLVIGPALWLHARALTEDLKPGRPALLHFAPALLLAVLLFAPTPEDAAAAAAPVDRRGAIDLTPVLLIAAHLCAYAAATTRRALTIRRSLLDRWSSLEGRTLGWLILLACLLSSVVLAWIAAEAAGFQHAPVLATLLCALALSLIAFQGVSQRNVLVPRPLAAPPVPAPAPADDPATDSTSDSANDSANDPPPAARKYARAPLAEARAAALREALTRGIADDKPHLQVDLGIADLAAAIGATPHELSHLLSQHLAQTFYDFINRQRVDAVKAELARPRSASRPLLEVALECGFGSKSAFNDAFRRHTGTSPSEYRRRLIAS